MNLKGKSIKELSQFVLSDAGDLKVANFMDKIIHEVGNKEGYLSSALGATKELKEDSDIIPNVFEKLEDLFWPFISTAPTGHGVSHMIQDALTAAVMVNDYSWYKNLLEADLWAGVLGGILHDVGNSLVPRYEDYKRRAGHAEIGAWLVFYLLEDLLSEQFRKLIAYCMAAHTHYTKSVVIKGKGCKNNNHKGDYHRPIYWYEDFNSADKRWPGVGIVIVRAIDRMGTRGVVHWGRHFLVVADTVQTGIVGMDLTKKEVNYQVDIEALRVHLKPTMGYEMSSDAEKKIPTVLQHVTNYQGSDLGKNGEAFGRNDGYLGVFYPLMIDKHSQTELLTNIVVNTTPDLSTFSRTRAMVDFKNVLSVVSRSLTFNNAWEVIYSEIVKLSDENLARWQNGSILALSEQTRWMDKLIRLAYADADSPLIPFLNKIVPHSF